MTDTNNTDPVQQASTNTGAEQPSESNVHNVPKSAGDRLKEGLQNKIKAPQEPKDNSTTEDTADYRSEYEKAQSQLHRIKLEAQKKERESQKYKMELKKLKQQEEYLKKLKSDPTFASKELGLTLESMAEMVLEGKELPTPEELEKSKQSEEFNSLKQELEEIKKYKQQQEEQIGFQNDLRQIDSFLKQNQQHLPFLGHMNYAPQLTKQVYETYKKTGEVPDIRELAWKTEQAIQNDIKTLFNSKAGINYLKNNQEIRKILADTIFNNETTNNNRRNNSKQTQGNQAVRIGTPSSNEGTRIQGNKPRSKNRTIAAQQKLAEILERKRLEQK